jgi:response regulator RpfG family c-di-GMP phosphodiesterase
VRKLDREYLTSAPPAEWNPAKNINDTLKEAIHNKNLTPEKKSQAVYENSVKLMDNLLANPTTDVIALQHHEREDGMGYPRKLMGDEIHDYARICCIADVFDALTAERSYKKALAPFEALRVMKEEMLGHFHKEIFKNFVLLFQ